MEKQTDYNYFITFIVLNERGFLILHNIKKQGYEVLRQEEKERNACQMAISKRNIHLNLGNRKVASNQKGYVYLQTPNSTWELPAPAPGQSTKPLTAPSCGQGRESTPRLPRATPQRSSATTPAFTAPAGNTARLFRRPPGNTGALTLARIPLLTGARPNAKGDSRRLKIPAQQLRPATSACRNSLTALFAFKCPGFKTEIIRFLRIDLFSRSTFTALLP